VLMQELMHCFFTKGTTLQQAYKEVSDDAHLTEKMMMLYFLWGSNDSNNIFGQTHVDGQRGPQS
jgi:hypothetical protein